VKDIKGDNGKNWVGKVGYTGGDYGRGFIG